MKRKKIYDTENNSNDFMKRTFDDVLSPTGCDAHDADTDDAGEVAMPKPLSVRKCLLHRIGNKLSDKKISVELYFDRNIDADDEITIACSTADYLPMCESGSYDVQTFAGRPYVRIRVDSSYIWLPDEYRIVVFSDMKPVDSFAFAFDGVKFTLREHHRVDAHSEEYVIANAGFNGTCWRMIRSIPGVSGMLRKLIAHCRMNVVNRWRGDSCLCDLPHNRHYIVVDSQRLFCSLLPGLACADYSIRTIDCNEALEPRSANEEAFDYSDITSCRGKAIHLRNIAALSANAVNPLINKLLNSLMTVDNEWSLIIDGSRREVDDLLRSYPALKDYIADDHILCADKPKRNEMVHYMESCLKLMEYELTDKAYERVCEIVDRDYAAMSLCRDLSDNIRREMRRVVPANFSRRVLDAHADTPSADTLKTIVPSDLDGLQFVPVGDEYFECLDELNRLVGLSELKSSLATELNKERFLEMRRSAGLRNIEASPHHIVFTGNPGTGKTTVAKMIGRIYHSLGLLSKGEVIVTERTKLVGQYIGETEKNMAAVLERARGNVLFIDEAYTLYNGSDDRKDFGMRVIESLLTVLSQPNPDMIVVLAGYEREMTQMLESNPGLKGRFPNHFYFPDYDADELTMIALRMLAEQDYMLDECACMRLRRVVADEVSRKDRYFSNARWIKNFIDGGVVPAMAGRISALMRGGVAIADTDILRRIVAADIDVAAKSLIGRHSASEAASYRRRVGFIA